MSTGGLIGDLGELLFETAFQVEHAITYGFRDNPATESSYHHATGKMYGLGCALHLVTGMSIEEHVERAREDARTRLAANAQVRAALR